VTVIRYGGSGGSSAWSSRAFPDTPLHASSLATTPLEVLDLTGNRFSHGTGFVYRLDGRLYLVTAWHVLSGRDFFTRKLNPQGLIPSTIRFFAPAFRQQGEALEIRSESIILDLTAGGQDILGSPPEPFGFPVDVAVAKLPLTTTKAGEFTSKGLNDFSWGFEARTRSPIQSMIGADIFVLGYPLGTYEGLRTPLWKRGILASEPCFEIFPRGAFLVDVNSAVGMSGGPIVRRVATFTADNKDEGIIQEIYDEALIGIYSGRALSASESSFVLGYGWPIDMVHKIIAEGQCFSGPEA
jgi:Trypsin-like peptidase domain